MRVHGVEGGEKGCGSIEVKFRCVLLACSVSWMAGRPGVGGVGGAVKRGGGWVYV